MKKSAMAVFLALLATSPRAWTATLEYKIKAGYLLNFTRYVEWPQAAFAHVDSPVVICVLGVDPFGDTLEKTIANRSSNGRRVIVRRFERPGEASTTCHLVFISHSEKDRAVEFLKATSGRPVLTVGESTGFLQHGGIINLVIVEDTVQFEVSLSASEAAALKLSSRMLPLARKLVTQVKAGGEQ